MTVEVTSMSSRGQIVIPQEIRETMKLEEGTKFTVIGLEDTIILKKIKRPTKEEFEEAIRKIREKVKESNIKPSDVVKAIRRVRQDEMRNRH